jgi:hypothetical protein
MWQAVERFGFTGGRILEPAAGIGHFIGAMPRALAERSRSRPSRSTGCRAGCCRRSTRPRRRRAHCAVREDAAARPLVRPGDRQRALRQVQGRRREQPGLCPLQHPQLLLRPRARPGAARRAGVLHHQQPHDGCPQTTPCASTSARRPSCWARSGCPGRLRRHRVDRRADRHPVPAQAGARGRPLAASGWKRDGARCCAHPRCPQNVPADQCLVRPAPGVLHRPHPQESNGYEEVPTAVFEGDLEPALPSASICCRGVYAPAVETRARTAPGAGRAVAPGPAATASTTGACIASRAPSWSTCMTA